MKSWRGRQWGSAGKSTWNWWPEFDSRTHSAGAELTLRLHSDPYMGTKAGAHARTQTHTEIDRDKETDTEAKRQRDLKKKKSNNIKTLAL